MEKRDYYEVLGVSKTEKKDEIKSAFRKLAKKYHPDINHDADAPAKFKEAEEAYSVLSDDSKRKQYDQFGHAAFEQGAGGAGGFSGADFSNFDFGDIFGDLFGNSGFGGFSGGSATNSRAAKGRDTLKHVHLTFDEAVFGCKKDINIDTIEECSECGGKGVSYEHTCTSCHGKGRVKVNKTIEVKIPAGVDDGNQLRVPGKGEAGVNGGRNGDLYLEFEVDEHDIFERDGLDIYLNLPITVSEATLGCKKEIPTLYGNVKLTIPAGTQPGDKQRLRDKGIADPNSYSKGNMYVVIKVVIPSKLSRDQKKLYEELADTENKDDSIFKKIRDFLK